MIGSSSEKTYSQQKCKLCLWKRKVERGLYTEEQEEETRSTLVVKGRPQKLSISFSVEAKLLTNDGEKLKRGFAFFAEQREHLMPMRKSRRQVHTAGL